jgi:hypothetical protein
VRLDDRTFRRREFFCGTMAFQELVSCQASKVAGLQGRKWIPEETDFHLRRCPKRAA